MGLAASQARFLGLTARKTNIEFEGQQVNQQRTSLSNQSANYYNDLLGMNVPTPPSVDSFTKTSYTFEDGALSNEITALIAQNDGKYTLSYLSKWQDDYTVVSSASSIVTKNGGNFMVGSKKLRTLGQMSTTPANKNLQINKGGKTYNVKKDDDGYYIEKTETVEGKKQLTAAEIENIEYYSYDSTTDTIKQLVKENGEFKYVNDDGTFTAAPGVTEDDLIMSLFDSAQTNPEHAVLFVNKDDNGNYFKQTFEEKTEKEYLTDAEVATLNIGGNDDEYLDGLNEQELKNLKSEELMYLALLQQEYGEGTEWYVRYAQDSQTGQYIPYFYNQSDINNASTDANGNILSNIKCYTTGSKQRIEEYKAIEDCRVERDSSGRFISISIPNSNGTGYITYPLTTCVTTDQDAYGDAMNKYEHEKYLYDQAVQDINSKIEITQAQDKNLELRLKQLDTEQKAVSTEMDSVSKVIEKNTESTFKTFG